MKIFLGILTGLVAGVLLFILIFGIGLYTFSWPDWLVSPVVKILPFPAAKVGSYWINYSDYFDNLKAIKYFFSQQSAEESYGLPSEVEMKQIIINRLIMNAILPSLATMQNIGVSDQDVESAYQALVAEKGDEKAVLDFLKQWYGWDKKQYLKYFLRPQLYEDKLSQIYDETLPENIDAKNKAEEILKKIRNKEADFSDLAKEYSQDNYAADGGNIGFVPRGYLPTEIEDELFASKPGTITDVLSLADSYQIIKVISVDESEGMIELARIYLKIKNLDDVIEEYKIKNGVSIYVK